MADTKLTGLTALSGFSAPADLMYVVDDPSGTPASVKATRSQISPWDVIGDTTISSAVASISHTIDVSLYSEIIVRVVSLANASGDINGMFWGWQAQTSGDVVVWDKAGEISIHATGAAAISNGTLRIYATAVANDPVQAVAEIATTGGFSDRIGSSQASVDLSAAAKLVFFFSDDASNFDVATASNTTAGRIITYGLRKP